MMGLCRAGYIGRRRSGGPSFPVVAVVGLLFLLFLSGPMFFHFFPALFLFGWLAFLVIGPVIRASARGVASLSERSFRQSNEKERKEKEILEALGRHGEITAAQAALETSLSVAEADQILGDLAKSGYIEVRAREGRLAYALWDHDRRELTD